MDEFNSILKISGSAKSVHKYYRMDMDQFHNF